MFWFIISGVLFIILAIPLIRRRVQPNSWYGFRSKQTLSDPEIWYEANAFAGKGLLLLGLLIIAATVLLPILLPDQPADFYVLLMTAFLLSGVLLLLLLSVRFAKALKS